MAAFYEGQSSTAPHRVLFLCTHNSSRSQMAEGLLRVKGGTQYQVFSAGTYPRKVHPLAIKAMAEMDIDISEQAGHRAKGIEEFETLPPMDLVVTVCDEAAEECPYFPRACYQERWGFPDPSAAIGTEAERLDVFRHVRDVRVETKVRIERIDRDDTWLHVIGSNQFHTTTDLVLIAVGVEPHAALAQATGIEVVERGAIRVTRKMETNLPDIYAAGDCVETWHRVLNRATYLPLGSTAHKQGRIAGENAVGGSHEFAGTLGTQVVKVFDLVIARTGLRDDVAAQAGFDPITVESTAWDHKVYYPDAHEMRIRITGDHKTGRLLGAQMLGHMHSEIAKRIDIFATALFHRMHIEELNDLDLSYTPPLSSPWDPVQMSAQVWVKALRLNHSFSLCALPLRLLL